jgi:thymidine phosphorylase
MDARGIIWKLRQKARLSEAEIAWFARGLASGEVTDAQAGAFAMAACLNGLTTPERVALTLAMRDSGDTLRWDLPGPVVDKHSTGGLGDCVSLLLAPMLACAGVFNPMISGRGLGHTGGTLDKMEAIPGVVTEVSEDRFRAIVADVGCAIVSASGNLAPADRRLYAIRDVTSTVESIDLITASILSKKLAAGLDFLVLDVKAGSGAFMATMEEARALARSLVDTANGAGCRTVALLTDMNQPLAPTVGNALEVAVCMEVLEAGSTDSPLAVLTVELVAELLVMAGVQASLDAARKAAADTLSSGAAMDRFGRMVAALGGPADFCRTWRRQLPQAPVTAAVAARRDGHVAAVDGRALGDAVVRLGGGRLKGGDAIDPAVGLSGTAAIGTRVPAGAPLAVVHAADAAAAAAAAEAVLAAYTISDEPAEAPPLIRERIA